MKIGIITFHRAINYGSILQAYALSRFLRDEIGENNVEVIDYQNLAQRRIYRLFECPKGIKSMARDVHTFVNLSSLKAKYKKFREFAENKLGLSSKSYRETDIRDMTVDSRQYTHLICGSDQIWNVRCADSDENYFLVFNSSAKKIAYAPSLGRLDFTAAEEEYFKRNIDGYHALSVRELNGADYLEKLCGRKVECVVDPVFLLDDSKWDKIAVAPPNCGKYILCYFISDVAGMRSFAKRLSLETGLKIVSVIKNLRDVFSGFESRFDAGPQEFLGLLENAEYIVTDSFHAVSFSLIFHKKFWVFLPPKNIADRGSWTRIPNLLNIVKLENRILNADNCRSINVNEGIVFAEADRNLALQVEKSKVFINNALGLI